MSKLKVILNREGVRQLLKSQEMLALCEERAQAALAKLGPGYEVNSLVGKTRVNAEIVAVSDSAIRENAENNTILKSLGGL